MTTRRPTMAITTAGVLAMLMIVTAAPAVAGGDIDGDGNDDLVVGVPHEDVGARRDAGAVQVLFGSSLRDQDLLFQPDGADGIEARDGFGGSVDLYDIDGDGFDDLIAGSPGERVAGYRGAGAVQVIPGGPDGLRRSGADTLHEGDGLPGAPGTQNAFGWDVVAGDFDGDGFGDLAISAVGEAAGGAPVAGSVTVVPGSAAGLVRADALVVSEDGGFPGRPEAGDAFGRSLAVGDFDGDGYDDLAVGAPGERVRGALNAGAVFVIAGSPTGLRPDQARRFTQVALSQRAESDDLFGFAVIAVDANCDGRDELAIGVPNEDVRGVQNAGVVHVLRGTRRGVTARSARLLAEGSGGVPGRLTNAGFGKALAAGDFDADSCEDLAIGAPFAQVGSFDGAGTVTVVRGSRRWRADVRARTWSRFDGLPGRPARDDFLGSALAVVDLDGNRRDELVIGVPGDDVGGVRDAGSLLLVRKPGVRTGRGASVALSQRRGMRGQREVGDQVGSTLQDGLS